MINFNDKDKHVKASTGLSFSLIDILFDMPEISREGLRKTLVFFLLGLAGGLDNL